MRRLPPLTALPAFEATARLGSVTAAAEELGRTHGAISKQLKHLAEDLGVALFEKEGVGLKLTREGRQLQAVCAPLLDQLAAGCDALRPDVDPNLLRVGVSATFAMRWLTPRLPRFYARHPGVEVIIKMAGRFQITAEDVDTIITWDRLNWMFDGERLPSTAAASHAEEMMLKRRLGDVAFGVVSAPDYPIERAGGCARAAIGIKMEGGPGSWDGWSELSGVRFEFETMNTYPHTFLGLEAAAAGLGVMVTADLVAERHLGAGRLVAPMGFITVPNGVGAHISPRSARRRIVAQFLDWVEEEVAAGPREF